jgi:SAM-dependent methyltransferase
MARQHIERLERVIASRPDRPQVGGPDHPMRKVTRQIAFEPGGWTAERRAKVADLFDGLAPDWNSRFTSEESSGPLDDAFARGGALTGPCLEVGAGTGLATQRIGREFDQVVAIDVSIGMLQRFIHDHAQPVLADAGALPLADAFVGTIIAVNAFLFPSEYDRVLGPGGAIVWINSLAEDTPIHLPVDEAVDALPGAWTAVTSEAGWGLWAVIRRA